MHVWTVGPMRHVHNSELYLIPPTTAQTLSHPEIVVLLAERCEGGEAHEAFHATPLLALGAIVGGGEAGTVYLGIQGLELGQGEERC